MTANPADLPALAKALRSYEQLDQDGVMVAVSRQACDEAAAALTALTERNAELEKALEPFAKLAEQLNYWHDTWAIFDCESKPDVSLRYGHLRRAAAVHSKLQAPGGGDERQG